MFKQSSVLFSALSKRTKRVRVQTLKDFPEFQLFKGQVSLVKPSLMRNYLHNNNGARYILKDNDIDPILFERNSKREEEVRKLMERVDESVISKKEAAVKGKRSVKAADATASIKEEKEPYKSILEKDVNIKNVKIPGLDL